jgi:hypothetical protein
MKAGYGNVELGPHGEMRVQGTDPSVGKTIPHAQGLDSTVVLATETRKPIYEAALQKQSQIDTAIQANVKATQSAYLVTERNLLDAIEEWKTEQDVAVRRGISVRIGELTKQLQTADTAMRDAMYPFRYRKREAIPKLFIDYATRDERQLLAIRAVGEKANARARTFTLTAEGRV